ncbi:hypothetical protein J2S00_003040 [Caldalkalibacillus uzonensis]|uniref:Uncharacterized protein n=1 Tax=Caldalkalibacillus uzonensis TaxID=353224 RepID=A0ABU0CV32_9BACI|nr:hypothetical protein [Caldalkalibacillus uzonensis]MDQ0340235.1 hypothetical protein [Caldalkalibacillus uzonensis]
MGEHKEVIQTIEKYVEQESEKWVEEVLHNAKSLSDLTAALWERGKVKKDGTEVERVLHRLVYERGAVKIKDVIKENESLAIEKALSQKETAQ